MCLVMYTKRFKIIDILIQLPNTIIAILLIASQVQSNKFSFSNVNCRHSSICHTHARTKHKGISKLIHVRLSCEMSRGRIPPLSRLVWTWGFKILISEYSGVALCGSTMPWFVSWQPVTPIAHRAGVTGTRNCTTVWCNIGKHRNEATLITTNKSVDRNCIIMD